MSARWFQLEDYYEHVGEISVFYPSLYARGYRFSAEERATMDGVLGPFLNRRLMIEFIAAFCGVTFSLMIAMAGFLMVASNEQLDMVLQTPPWVWLLAAVTLGGVILVPILFRLRWKIRRQLDVMGLEASEPPRPDFFIVDGAFSLRRLSYVFFALGLILALVGNMGPAGAVPIGLYAFAFVSAFTLLVFDWVRS